MLALQPRLAAGFRLLGVTERHWGLTLNMTIKPALLARRFFLKNQLLRFDNPLLAF